MTNLSLLERARTAPSVPLSFDDLKRIEESPRRGELTATSLRQLVRCAEAGTLQNRVGEARFAQSLRASLEAKSQVLRLKRMLDVVGALIGLIVLSPLLIGVAIAIRLTTPGPALFRQWRYGLRNVPFEVYKFRTFYADRSDQTGVKQTVANDNRVTPLGRVLRRTNIDELPQLINILLGQMSLVGPRPHAMGMLADGVVYEKLISAYPLRHLVTPGLTGLAQVRGFRGPTTGRFAARGRLLNDLIYAQRLSVLLDVRIILTTVVQELRRASGS